VFLPLCAFIDPACDQIDLLRRKGSVLQWHAQFRIAVDDTAVQFAFLMMTRHDGGLAGFRCGESFFAKYQAKPTLFPDAAMAGQTFFIEYRPDLLVVTDQLAGSAALPEYKAGGCGQ